MNVVSLGDRKFVIIRKCRSDLMTDELKDDIKASNFLIDVVLSDGNGNLLFCHEPKDAEFRDLDNEESLPEKLQETESEEPSNE